MVKNKCKNFLIIFNQLYKICLTKKLHFKGKLKTFEQIFK